MSAGLPPSGTVVETTTLSPSATEIVGAPRKPDSTNSPTLSDGLLAGVGR